MSNDPFEYTHKNCGTHILVTSSGYQKNAAQLIEYAKWINDMCTKEGVCCVLLDERNVEIHTSFADELEVLEFVTIRSHVNNIEKLACVSSARFRHVTFFFEFVASARHFNFKAFMDVEDATEWLTN